MRIVVFVLLTAILSSCSDTSRGRFVEIKRGSLTLVGSFVNDTVPHGLVNTFNSLRQLVSKENFQHGILNGEAIYYHEKSGNIKVKTNFIGGVQSGVKFSYDSLGRLLSKTNYYYGKEIGPDFTYESTGELSEYSFVNFENEILYYCSFDKQENMYKYPSDSYLMRVTTEPVTIDNSEKLHIFLYLFNPPKLRLEYRICSINEADSLITLKSVPSDNFYYEHYLTLRNAQEKIALVVDKYDSIQEKKTVIIKQLKTSYP